MNINIKKILHSLNSCWTINKNVKQKAYKFYACPYCNSLDNGSRDCICTYCRWYWGWTEVDYNMRDFMYFQKTKIIKFCIDQIKNHRLPIKYWKNNDIIYFQYLNQQVSFHDPFNKIECKKFKWNWTWKINKWIPYKFIYNICIN